MRPVPITLPNLAVALELANELNHHCSEARKATALGERVNQEREVELRAAIRDRLRWALDSLDRQERRVM